MWVIIIEKLYIEKKKEREKTVMIEKWEGN